ncbi:MAG: phosphoribosylformylglycinamidine synthase subunit PurS [Candidatus Omnitrophica bacterium]|nr:phosphoribosylformylglycinamidine synthase subunit PurS [Candidatus Omnitrophota bacterium]
MLEAKINITLKKTIADPQGLTVKHALESLNYKEVQEVRMGKHVTVRLDSADVEKAKKSIDAMCRQLLSNPIIEDYSFEIKEL